MWAEFWLSAIVGVIMVYIPAFAILRALRFSKIVSAAFAPIASFLFYSLLAIVYGKLDIITDGWMLFVPLCVVGVGAYVLRLVLGRKGLATSSSGRLQPKGSFKEVFDEQGRLILLYACVGIVVATYVFLMSLDSADSTIYAYDDQSHLGVVQSFLERGNYSSLNINYRTFDMGGADGYYPAAWHLLAASIITICDVPNFVGINAVMFIMAALVYPFSCLMVVRKLFANNKNVQIAGAFLTLAFAAFPWEFFVYGRLAANLLAFCSLPAMLACSFYVFGKGESRKTRISFAALLFCSFVLSVFTQPSVCFSWLYFSVPYLLHVLWNWKPTMAKKRKIMLVAGFCVAVFLFLIFCYMLPFFYELTRFKWPATMTIPEAICDVVLQRVQRSPESIVLAVLVACGLFFAARKASTRWLVLLYAMFACLYVLDTTTNLKLRNYTVGWWYTDSYRVFAMFAIISYFIGAMGLGSLAELAFKRVRSVSIKRASVFAAVSIAGVLALLPSFSIGSFQVVTSMGSLRGSISGNYSTNVPDSAALFSAPEREFVQKAAEITGDDFVFNIPKDGSAFAYQASGMKVITRWSDEGISPVTNIRLLQRGFDDIATNSSVRRAADELGVKYVLMLDQGHEPFHDYWEPYSDSNWVGVLSIDEDTPGFELVMSEDDMKLYRVLTPEETEDQMRGLEGE